MKKFKADIMRWDYKRTPEDLEAIERFRAHEHEFNLDVGGLEERYSEARRFTEQYFGGKYFVDVEEYCCMCSVTSLYRYVGEDELNN